MTKKSERYVVVTTDEKRRGVFAGILESGEVGGSVVLRESRMIVYWSAATRGVLGIAVTGPADGSRVSPAAPRTELDGITSITDCSSEARKRIEEGPWS